MKFKRTGLGQLCMIVLCIGVLLNVISGYFMYGELVGAITATLVFFWSSLATFTFIINDYKMYRIIVIIDFVIYFVASIVMLVAGILLMAYADLDSLGDFSDPAAIWILMISYICSAVASGFLIDALQRAQINDIGSSHAMKCFTAWMLYSIGAIGVFAVYLFYKPDMSVVACVISLVVSLIWSGIYSAWVANPRLMYVVDGNYCVKFANNNVMPQDVTVDRDSQNPDEEKTHVLARRYKRLSVLLMINSIIFNVNYILSLVNPKRHGDSAYLALGMSFLCLSSCFLLQAEKLDKK